MTKRALLRRVVSFGSATLAGAMGAGLLDLAKSPYESSAAERARLAQGWWQELGIGFGAALLPGDDYSLYPTSNPISRRDYTWDPRALDVAAAMRGLASDLRVPSDLRLISYDQLRGLDGRLALPANLVTLGSTIINRASRVMLGGPIQEAFGHRFVSLDGTWCAELKIGQFTPPDAEVIETTYLSQPWDFWDHRLVIGSESITSRYDSKDKHPATQVDCYFHLTKLVSPPLEGGQQTVFMPTPLHKAGSDALAQLFQFPLDPAAARFISDLLPKAQRYPSWQAAGRVSKLSSDGRGHQIELLEFVPVETRYVKETERRAPFPPLSI